MPWHIGFRTIWIKFNSFDQTFDEFGMLQFKVLPDYFMISILNHAKISGLLDLLRPIKF
jgi:hypothetical protein